jgi:hypothetical protein
MNHHLSHFLLTAERFPLLEAETEEATGDARIVKHTIPEQFGSTLYAEEGIGRKILQAE